MTTYTEDFFVAAAAAIPGLGEVVCPVVSAQELAWPEFQRRLRAARRPRAPYHAVSHNCLHICREVLADMAEQWALDHPGEPIPAWGILWGDVPTDGDNRGDGFHAVLFCVDEQGLLYLGGAQDRAVMNQSRVGEIKRLDYLIVGGG